MTGVQLGKLYAKAGYTLEAVGQSFQKIYHSLWFMDALQQWKSESDQPTDRGRFWKTSWLITSVEDHHSSEIGFLWYSLHLLAHSSSPFHPPFKDEDLWWWVHIPCMREGSWSQMRKSLAKSFSAHSKSRLSSRDFGVFIRTFSTCSDGRRDKRVTHMHRGQIYPITRYLQIYRIFEH